MIYLANNLAFLQQLGAPSDVLTIDSKFFLNLMAVQGVLAFVLTAFAGPGLISSDLANGSLPLYLCRPLSRAEYVFGKASVLGILLSQITWIPGLVLFVVQATLAGPTWMWQNLWIAGSLIVSSLIWIASPIPSGDGVVCVGEMENCCRSAVAGHDVFRRRLCPGDQCRAADSVRTFCGPRLPDDSGVEFTIPG